MKQRRRTLKNRGYAASCRVKRIEEREDLEGVKQNTCQEVVNMRTNNGKMRQEVYSLKVKILTLIKTIGDYKIPLPPRLQYVESMLRNNMEPQRF